jgi:hypothetical protein
MDQETVTITGRLEREGILAELKDKKLCERNGVPSEEDLRELVEYSIQNGNEHGVQVLRLKDDQRLSRWVKGRGGVITEPGLTKDLREQAEAGIFVHVHNIRTSKSGSNLAYALPSEISVPGSFEAITTNDFIYTRVYGGGKATSGLLNIAHQDGLTLNIARATMPRHLAVVNQLRDWRGLGVKNRDLSVWKVRTGDNAGDVFPSSYEEFQKGYHLNYENSPVVISRLDVDARVDEHFLIMTWEQAKDLRPTYGSLDNLLFGNGLQRLGDRLGLSDRKVPYEKSLAEVAQKPLPPYWKLKDVPRSEIS